MMGAYRLISTTIVEDKTIKSPFGRKAEKTDNEDSSSSNIEERAEH